MVLVQMELNELPEISLLVVALNAVIILVHILLMLFYFKPLFRLFL